MANIVALKKCPKCKLIKTLDEFGNDKRRKGGKMIWCKVCRLECARAWRTLNRDKINKKLREWYCSHPGKNRAYHLKWYSENQEKARASGHRWKTENKDKVREHNRNRRAKEKQSRGKITAREWSLLLDKYSHKCLCCGKTGVKLTLDHVIPISKGGEHKIENAQPLCLSCNSKKNDKTIDYRRSG